MSVARNNRVEQVILSVLKTDWLKTAMVIAKSARECQRKDIPTSEEEIAASIDALRKHRQLESRGDMADWRHSEVRIVEHG